MINEECSCKVHLGVRLKSQSFWIKSQRDKLSFRGFTHTRKSHLRPYSHTLKGVTSPLPNWIMGSMRGIDSVVFVRSWSNFYISAHVLANRFAQASQWNHTLIQSSGSFVKRAGRNLILVWQWNVRNVTGVCCRNAAVWIYPVTMILIQYWGGLGASMATG